MTCTVEYTGLRTLSSTKPLLLKLPKPSDVIRQFGIRGMFLDLNARNVALAYPQLDAWRKVRWELTRQGSIRERFNSDLPAMRPLAPAWKAARGRLACGRSVNGGGCAGRSGCESAPEGLPREARAEGHARLMEDSRRPVARVVRDTEGQTAAPLRPVRLGRLDPVIEQCADGAVHIRAAQKLGPYHDTLSKPLEHWAKIAPERLFLAQRDTQGEWRKLTYSQVLSDIRRIAAVLLRRGLSAEKPIVVLSGNDIEHALLGLRRCTPAFPMRRSRPPIRWCRGFRQAARDHRSADARACLCERWRSVRARDSRGRSPPDRAESVTRNPPRLSQTTLFDRSP